MTSLPILITKLIVHACSKIGRFCTSCQLKAIFQNGATFLQICDDGSAPWNAGEWLFTANPGVFGLVGGWANPTGFGLIAIITIMTLCSLPFVRKGGKFEARIKIVSEPALDVNKSSDGDTYPVLRITCISHQKMLLASLIDNRLSFGTSSAT